MRAATSDGRGASRPGPRRSGRGVAVANRPADVSAALTAPLASRDLSDARIGSVVAVASHDDASAAHVAESVAHGVSLAEFPTTLEAARASREAGLAILMGAPNVVRGRSHTGNVAARELATAGLLDVLSSDYVPTVRAVWRTGRRVA